MRNKNLYIRLITTVIFLIYIQGCSKTGGTTQPPAGGGIIGNTTTISIYNMKFPASTTVKKGAIVKWVNGDSFAHTVTSDDGASFNGNLQAAASFSYQANTVGSFTYHCNIHSGMTGTLVVSP